MNSCDWYDFVVGKTTAPGRRNMEKLKKICDSLEERNLEISVARISRESIRLKWGPKKGTICCNKNLREYVRLRVSEQEFGVEVDEQVDEMERILMLERENQVLRAFIRKMEIG